MTIDGGGHLSGDDVRLPIRQLRVAAKFIEEHEPVSKRAKASRKSWHDRESERRDCAPRPELVSEGTVLSTGLGGGETPACA
jgi:hypothetical protein